MKTAWPQSKFTGFFREFQKIRPRRHDPQVFVCAGAAPYLHPDQKGSLDASGCGWSEEDATNACVGECFERLFAYPTGEDAVIESSYEQWPLDEPTTEPERWTLFHPEQYAGPNFPFEPLTRQTRCRWVCLRDVSSGEPQWVPEEFVYLFPRAGCTHQFCPAISTGLAAGTPGQPVVLRALQEVIERDALSNAWFGSYPIEEYSKDAAWSADHRTLLERPNLHWRFFRIQSPFSNHVTMVTVEGEDEEGYCHSIGSACRESREASWLKATLEAVQGRHYVRQLRTRLGASIPHPPLSSFAEHAAYYSFHPEELEKTILRRGHPLAATKFSQEEGVAALCRRLEKISPVLMRNLTPSALAANGLDWRIVKVVVPGLQPLHGDDRFVHLGGKPWSERPLAERNALPPHPFP